MKGTSALPRKIGATPAPPAARMRPPIISAAITAAWVRKRGGSIRAAKEYPRSLVAMLQ
jgi:hypothetical protein